MNEIVPLRNSQQKLHFFQFRISHLWNFKKNFTKINSQFGVKKIGRNKNHQIESPALATRQDRLEQINRRVAAYR